MKKINFTHLVISISMLLSAIGSASAQSRLQLIHNASAIALDTVDVYFNDIKFDNVVFRSATGLLSVPSGSAVININDRNSIDSGDQVLARLPINLVNNQAHIAMVAGLDNPANYSANPDGINTEVRLIVHTNTILSPSNSNQTALNIFHGTTDATKVDVFARPNTLLTNNLAYGNVTPTIFATSNNTLIDVRDSNGINNINTYQAPLQLFAKKSLAVFASGFIDPINNQNGKGFGLFAVDTNGGVAIQLAEAARIQIIHNSPDFIIDTVDVWANNALIINNLPFRKASTMLTVTPGNYDITVTKKFSVDTSAAVTLLKIPSVLFEGGKTYLGFISGVVDTNQYAPNPTGINRSLNFIGTNSFKEATTSGLVSVSFFNGVPDAPALDLNKISLPNRVKIADNADFNILTSASFITSTGNTIFNLTSADSTSFIGAYRLNTSTLSGASGVIFTSGVFSSENNPALAQSFGVFAAFSNGTVIELRKLTSSIQVIHNSADITADSVDVYLNGGLVVDNFAFRTALPFISLNASVPITIAIAPKSSLSDLQAFYTTTLVLDSFVNYYAIANGVINPASYKSNPNGRNTGFKIFTFRGARLLASSPKNVDLNYFHGSTDLQTTTARGSGQVQFLSRNNSYGDFHGYRAHTAQDNIVMDLQDAITQNVLTTGFANLATHQGKTGVVFASGFLNDSLNQNGDSLILFVAWPDGEVDSIAPPKPLTGIEDNIFITSKIVAYPNPASNSINVSMVINRSTVLSAIISDITGKIIFSKDFEVSTGVNTLPLNIESFNSGIYFLTIKTDSDLTTQKITIIK